MLCFFFFRAGFSSFGASFVSEVAFAVPFSSATGGEDVEALDLEMLGTFERLERADRAMERMLLVSESRGAEVGPGFLAVVSLDVDPEATGDRAFPLRCVWPFV